MRHMLKVVTAAGALLGAGAAIAPTQAQVQSPAPVSAANQDRPFASVQVARDAERYEAWLKANWKPGRETPAQLRQAAAKALGEANDPRAASRNYALIVVANARDWAAWQGLARALLAVPANTMTGSERYEVPLNASAAAYLAYQRAPAKTEQASALVTLADALKRRSLWRPAIEAYRTSLALVEQADVRAAFDTLRAERGFRIAEYKVENEAQTPRLCIQFSERIARTIAEPQKFIAVDGREPHAISIEGQQACVDGLAHGRRYEVLVRSGLTSETGDALPKQSELSVYVKDRAPTVRVAGRSYVLPSRGQQGLPITTINVDKVRVEILRVGDRSLVGTVANPDLQQRLSSYDVTTLRERTGQSIYKGMLDIASRPNEEVVTAMPVTEAIGTLKPGVYALVAEPDRRRPSDEDGQLAVQWFIVSDFGLSAFTGEAGIHAFVRSLATATPAAGVKVRLLARNNEVIGEAVTDQSGHVGFAAALARGEGGNAPAMIVAEGGPEADYAYLDLQAAAFDLSDRGVKGRAAPGPVDGFLYADRGVYRPGEPVNLVGLVRSREGRALGVPATLVVMRPDGVEHQRIALVDGGLGGRHHVLGLASTAMPGTWRARLHTDPKADPIATTGFLVEDFVPERLDMTLTADRPSLTRDGGGTITLSGKYLYGPPAADLAVEGDIIVKLSPPETDGYPGFVFGQSDEKVAPVRAALEGLPRTDKDGRARLAVTLPPVPPTTRPLEAELLIRLREPGGRTIERKLTLPVEATRPRIGLKALFKDGQVAEGQNADVDVVMIDAAGKALAGKRVTWTLLRLEQTWQWYSRDGQWAYEPVTATRKVGNGALTLDERGVARFSSPIEWGRYRLDVVSAEAGGPAASAIFASGWYAAETAESPEHLEVALDKPTYRPGETAKLRITSRHAGMALISLMGDGTFEHRAVAVAKGGTETEIPVTAAFGPGAYVAATLYRPMDEAQKRMPGRAIGLRWLAIDQSDRQLKVELGTPERVGSAAKVTVPVRVVGVGAGETARVTLAAVDVGILNLTRFDVPKPEQWFGAQRKLATEMRDLYGRLIDGMRADRGRLRSGGDGRGRVALEGSAPVEAPLALFSGIVTVAADGLASVDLQLPDFNGAVRLMAVAWSETKTGHGARDMTVRDAVALTVSGPRFLNYGDQAQLEIDLHNVELASTSLKLTVIEESEGQARETATRDVALAKGQRRIERVGIKPAALGRLAYTVTATGPDGLALKRRLTFDVKAPVNDIRRTVSAELKANGGTMKVTSDLIAELIPGRADISLAVGPTARLDLPRMLSELDRYPYGCAEQTVSRAMPLLYANALGKVAGLKTDRKLKERVQGAIDRVFEMQNATGAFGVWGPTTTDLWLTSFITDFLTRARETGFAVNARGLSQALDRLQNFIGYAQDFESGGEARAYALYVLARNGRAPTSELRYYADTRLGRFTTALSRAQLGAALAMTGDKERAERVFRAALDLAQKPEPTTGYRADYGSSLRDAAAVVTLAAETRVTTDETVRLRSVLAAQVGARSHTSTQEKAWLLLAANALVDEAASGKVSVGGTEHQGTLARRVEAAELAGAGLTITNRGETAVDAVVSVVGAALTPEPAISKGVGVSRSYYTLDGKPVDLKSAAGGLSKLTQSDRLVVVIRLSPPEDGGRMMVVDRLPAGLEIENPKLVDSGDILSLAWLKSTLRPDHTEFRDDRFVAAFTVRPKGAKASDAEQADDSADQSTTEGDADAEAPAKPAAKPGDPPPGILAAYIVRAVTPGQFAHPAATVEDMYRPERFARTGAGRLEIVAK